MAHVATHLPVGSATAGAVKRVLDRIGHWLVSAGAMNAQVRQIEALAALSDADLAARGLRREDIARHVLRGRFWV